MMRAENIKNWLVGIAFGAVLGVVPGLSWALGGGWGEGWIYPAAPGEPSFAWVWVPVGTFMGAALVGWFARPYRWRWA